MDCEGAALNECLVARFVLTGVRALIGMYSVMTLKVGLPVEALSPDRSISLKLCVQYNDGD